MDELSIVVGNNRPDIIAITETWLSSDILDSVCGLSSYSVIRKDRKNGLGGGVLFYIKDKLCYHKLDHLLADNNFEILFISVRPRILPRPLGCVIFIVVYCPPWYDVATNRELCTFIFNSIDKLARLYPNAGFLMVGDFNTLDTNIFNKHLCFKQIVNTPTRGNNILDKIFTNCDMYYSVPVILPPLGKSDHSIVWLTSNYVINRPIGHRIIMKRHLNLNILDTVAEELNKVNWHEFYCIRDIQCQADLFYAKNF